MIEHGIGIPGDYSGINSPKQLIIYKIRKTVVSVVFGGQCPPYDWEVLQH
jgi:hypothetical protein